MRPGRLRVQFLEDVFISISGNVAVVTASFAPVIAVMAALAIDIGAISAQKSALQGHADLAAVAAASDLLNPETAAKTYLSDNGRSSVNLDVANEEKIRATEGRTILVETGRYIADREIAPADRFVPGAAPVNAARVSLTEPQKRYFEFIGGTDRKLNVSGVAVISAEAGISVGSRLVRLDDGLLNSFLKELTGAEISLSAMSYEALLDADIDMLDCLEWLAEDLELTAATYDDVLSTNIGLEDFLSALAAGAGENVLARQALRTLAQKSNGTLVIGDLIDIGRIAHRQIGHPPPGQGVHLNALPLMMASAIIANGTNQIDLDLSADIGKLVSIDASLLVGERPQGQSWFALSGVPGTPVSTEQLRLSIEAQVGGGALLNDALVRLPLHIDLASAEARITDMECEPGAREASQVDVAVKPTLARVRIAEVDLTDASGSGEPARLIDGHLIQVKGYSDIRAENPNEKTLRFLAHDIGGDPKTVGTDRALEGLLMSAISSLDYQVAVAGLSLLSTDRLKSRLTDLAEDLAEPLDDIVFTLTSSMGLGLGEADVWVHTATCNAPVLVQ